MGQRSKAAGKSLRDSADKLTAVTDELGSTTRGLSCIMRMQEAQIRQISKLNQDSDTVLRAAIHDRNRAKRDCEAARKAAHHWRITAYISLLAAIGVLLACIMQSAPKAQAAEPVQEPQQYTGIITPRAVDKPAEDALRVEKEAIARTVWGEARGCDTEGQENVVWTVLARYDDGRFGDSIIEVVSSPYQFVGYSANNPVEPEILDTVDRIVDRWLDGDPGPGYLFFSGDGEQNYFRMEE